MMVFFGEDNLLRYWLLSSKDLCIIRVKDQMASFYSELDFVNDEEKQKFVISEIFNNDIKQWLLLPRHVCCAQVEVSSTSWRVHTLGNCNKNDWDKFDVFRDCMVVADYDIILHFSFTDNVLAAQWDQMWQTKTNFQWNVTGFKGFKLRIQMLTQFGNDNKYVVLSTKR